VSSPARTRSSPHCLSAEAHGAKAEAHRNAGPPFPDVAALYPGYMRYSFPGGGAPNRSLIRASSMSRTAR
jgi:hypothetical protein